MNDLRFAARQLSKYPFANAVIVLTVGLLVGAASVLYASLRNDQLRLTPFPERERMVKLWRVGAKGVEQLFPAALYRDFAEKLSSFDEVGALDWRPAMTLSDVGEPVSYNTAGVSASLLRMTGVTPVQGRLFDEMDEQTASGHRVLISEQLWREKLEGDPEVVGRGLRLNDRLYTVVGVLPETLRSTRLAFHVDIWLPDRFERNRPGANLWLFARLKPIASRRQAQAELDVVAPALEQHHAPDAYERAAFPGGFGSARIAELSEQPNQFQRSVPAEVVLIWIFAGILTASIVGIACFNITHLLLVRAAGRTREFAIRLSLGAGRWRVSRQTLGESLLITAIGGALGLAVSFWFHDLLRLQHVDSRFDWRLYALTAGGTLVLGILVALLPAFQLSRANLSESLKDAGQTVSGRRRHRLRNFLISSEVAMALILCVVAGALVRTYLRLNRGALGFEPDKTLAVTVNLRSGSYPEPANQQAYAGLALRALREMPGIEAAAVTLNGGLFSWNQSYPFQVRGETSGRTVRAVIYHASRSAAGIEGMRLLAGRDLADNPDRAADEALVNESFVRQYFRGADPLGQQLHRADGVNWATVVGVVSDRHPITTLQGVLPEVIYGFGSATMPGPCTFTVRTRVDAKVMARLIRETVKRVDTSQPVNAPVFVSDLVKQREADSRAGMLTLGGLAGVGLLIALMGVYGVVAFSVVERTREVGLRMAVGASRASVLRLMLWQGGRLLVIGAVPGLLIGTALLLGLPRRGLLDDLNAFDPLTHLGVLLVVGVAGLFACALPARKAANLNPMEALRYE